MGEDGNLTKQNVNSVKPVLITNNAKKIVDNSNSAPRVNNKAENKISPILHRRVRTCDQKDVCSLVQKRPAVVIDVTLNKQ